MFKTMMIKSFVKPEVKSVIKGRIRLSFDKINMLPDGADKYLPYVEKALKLLDGVIVVTTNKHTGSVLIKYDPIKLTSDEVLYFVEEIIEEGLKTFQAVEVLCLKTPEDIEEFAVGTMEKTLRKKADDIIADKQLGVIYLD